MSKQLKVYCKNIEEYIDINGGDSLLDIYRKIANRIPFNPVCARVNYKAEDLSYAVFHPKMVEFLPVTSASGTRTYVRSLCMMLYKAVAECFPGKKLCIEHSISNGYFCRINDGWVPDESNVNTLKNKMTEYVEADIPFERKERLTKDVIEIFRHQSLDDKVLLLETLNELYTTYYRLGDICDSYYGQLVPSTSYLKVFDLIPYKDGFLLMPFDKNDIGKPAKFVSQEKMFRAFTEYLEFNKIVGINNVGELNKAVEENRSAMAINVSEAMHNKKIATISDEITARYRQGGAKVVLIAGPSSSGKTTFTKRLAIQLMTNLIEPQLISLDDYFVDRHHTPRDEDGEYDYESLYALNLDLFNSHLNALLRGEEVELPYYNFSTGTSEFRGNRIRLKPNSILLIEGIHGLNPELTKAVEQKMKYLIYVSALTTISIDDHNWIPTTDNRLLRRIIRDHKYRGASAMDTIRRWPSVRRGEEKWIFPYQENADSTFNSSLLFELGVLKNEGEEILRRVPKDVPEFGEASRLRKFLSYFAPVSEKYVPSTSLLREFLGGSSFNY
ncbi:MAG: nucleoside kinase [Bacteroidales bacterium]|nr:nucleoside kinase [Bacteroidales bacterium]MBD5240863.1 nucleoside kinase [Barnesiella sp.]MBD5256686.1 nucleoside kinase [Bacteroides sp.]MDE5836131.1 nucleoside kinase [Paramuribaculum sp.]